MSSMQVVTADALDLAACHDCGLAASAPREGERRRCKRCGAVLHRRLPDSYGRAWAYLIAATVLYIPANVLTMVRTSSFIKTQEDTIMSGVIALWREGIWDMGRTSFGLFKKQKASTSEAF